MVSELFDPAAWRPVDGFDFTDITYHRAVDQGTVRIAFDRPEVRNAFRPHTVDELYHRARPRPHVDRRRLRAADRQRAIATRRRVGVLLGRRPAHPRERRLQVRGRRDGRHDRAGPGRAPAHPRGPAADPVHAQGRHLRRARLGGRRRPQPARRVRPHAGQRRARPLQADRRRRAPASTAGSARPTWPARSARSSPARSSSSAASTPPPTTTGWVPSTPSCPTPSWRPTALEWAAEINAKSPTAQRMLKYAFNLDRRRARRAAAVRRRGHPPGLRDRRGGRGPRRVPREAPAGLVRRAVPLLTMPMRRRRRPRWCCSSCPDQRGLVAAVANFVVDARGEHRPRRPARRCHGDEAVFFQRVEFELDGFGLRPSMRSRRRSRRSPARYGDARRGALHRPAGRRRRSSPRRQPHCLADLLVRWASERAAVRPPRRWSPTTPDHAVLCAAARRARTALAGDRRRQQETGCSRRWPRHGVELVVLAPVHADPVAAGDRRATRTGSSTSTTRSCRPSPVPTRTGRPTTVASS